MTTPVRRLRGPFTEELLLGREWLVTNGLGGYASGTLCGAATRRYHGLLVAALPAPLGRSMMFNHLSEVLRLPDGTRLELGAVERADRTLEIPGAAHLEEFRLEAGLPVWRYRSGAHAIEKRVWMTHRANTTYVNYRVVDGEGTLRLKLHPAVHFRGHDAAVSDPLGGPYLFRAVDDRYELSSDGIFPPLHLQLRGQRSAFTLEQRPLTHVLYRIEEHRGYAAEGQLFSPGFFRVDLSPGVEATLIASTEPWERVQALPPEAARRAEEERRQSLVRRADLDPDDAFAAELTLAADQFIITPAGRVEDGARARAIGDEACTVVAGYHWFTDWGRDTMISLEGLCLLTERHREARWILRTFAGYVRNGLIPNLFPEGSSDGLYHTADATLWFFHALDRYLAYSGDFGFLRELMPLLENIIRQHVTGTRFGIRVDPHDGLLSQGEEGYALTWMDAKCGDWVVTPRRGKAVEINALWYNAVSLMAGWMKDLERPADADELTARAKQVDASFNERFWFNDGGYLYDVIDGPDAKLDP
ncbi:MAG: glycogen debranching enzyme, partial [Myxococcales bacterium]|nr:glycogen debranching enzyme [Myxococcales bacterium]